MYNAYITRIKNVRPHGNADRLQLGDCFGNTVCVNLDYKEGQLGVYFPTDGQLSEEFCEQHNLVRKKDDAGNNIGGYMDPNKRNVTAIRLRGEKSDGLFMPIECLAYTGVDLSTLTEGFCFTCINGHEICQKYIPRRPNSAAAGQGNRTRKKKVPVAPLFVEHADTEQLAYNLGAFRPGDEIEITLKMHGTSQRTGYLPVLRGYTDSFGCRAGNAIRHLLNKMGCYHGEDMHDGEPIYDWDYVSGTRRVVLEDYAGGFYGDNSFREQHSKTFEGKLWKGETAYYEVVGFTQTGTPIMGDGNNEKVGKDFVKQYGKTTTFSYGCEPHPVVHEGYNDSAPGYQDEQVEYKVPQSDIYVYRMTMTNEDGQVVEYTPDFMRYRCEMMGIKCVPVFWKGIITPTTKGTDCQEYACWCGEWIGACGGEEAIGNMVKEIAEKYYAGPDPIGKTHTREGVVVRIINRPKFTAYKHKNFEFKVLEGIIKDSATAPDIEEAQEVTE